MKRLVVLGSTGSIGTQTLAVLRQFPDAFRVVGLSAGDNMVRLAAQIADFRPQTVCVRTAENAETLRTLLGQERPTPVPEIWVGEPGLRDLACLPEADTVVVGLVGFTGVRPTLEALAADKTVLTANKETFVTAGHLVRPYLDQIVPLDSEHSAIFQCLQGCAHPRREVHRLYLTASGGPFLGYSMAQLEHVTIDQALQHPNWRMGNKVTIDSATMMNKGLETIEAQHLFGLPLDKIEVVIHPQSIVHSAVAFCDGSILSQMGQPDMRVPLQYGLTWPERWPTPDPSLHLDLTTLGQLDFAPADLGRFPALRLARWAAELGGSMPVVLNAADEMAVEAFLQGDISFLDIPRRVEALMQAHLDDFEIDPSLETIIALDANTRARFSASDRRLGLTVVTV